jgi:hypothetical protein
VTGAEQRVEHARASLDCLQKQAYTADDGAPLTWISAVKLALEAYSVVNCSGLLIWVSAPGERPGL